MSAPPSGSGRTFVGFGFGAIQAGLFLYEAYRSGNFGRLVVAYRRPEVIAALRRAGGQYALNIAHRDRIETNSVGPVEMLNVHDAGDRQVLIEAIAEASEVATALSSIEDYQGPGEGSVHRLLADGLRAKLERRGPRAVLYAAENHNHAAERLSGVVLASLPEGERDAVQGKVRFLNTVIGKMCQTVRDPHHIARDQLEPMTPELAQAFLVEAFNRIYVSSPGFEAPFERGFERFVEKTDLLPFEEAKLYGHNATHALAAYLAQVRGLSTVAELATLPGAVPFLRAAFFEESGAALVRKYQGFDPLFTSQGYEAYAEDLLQRMMNPYLRDSVARVARDPRRKLGWEDRLVGTMRLALSQGIAPRRYALGVAAALEMLAPDDDPRDTLKELWRPSLPDPAEVDAVLSLVAEARQLLDGWRVDGGGVLGRLDL